METIRRKYRGGALETAFAVLTQLPDGVFCTTCMRIGSSVSTCSHNRSMTLVSLVPFTRHMDPSNRSLAETKWYATKLTDFGIQLDSR